MQQWTELIGVVVWPIVVVFTALLFRTAVRDLLTRNDVSFTGPGGIGFSARRATGALLDAEEDKNRSAAGGPPGRVAEDTDGAGRPLSAVDAADQVRAVGAAVSRLGRSPRLLWVDDRPSNNRLERSALENMGMTVDISTSTEDAQRKLQRRAGYDLVISDMARPEDPRAGYVLLDWMRERGDDTPFVIYSSSNSAAHYDEAVRNGAVGSTGQPTELIDMVLRSLRDVRPRRWWHMGSP
jgi:CheY-like chemotaxis protein